jgi:hypothetical protein
MEARGLSQCSAGSREGHDDHAPLLAFLLVSGSVEARLSVGQYFQGRVFVRALTAVGVKDGDSPCIGLEHWGQARTSSWTDPDPEVLEFVKLGFPLARPTSGCKGPEPARTVTVGPIESSFRGAILEAWVSVYTGNPLGVPPDSRCLVSGRPRDDGSLSLYAPHPWPSQGCESLVRLAPQK